MNAAVMLSDLEKAGVRVRRDGDDLIAETPHGASLDPCRDRLREAKSLLLEELRLREAIIAALDLGPEDFNRSAYHALMREYEELQQREIVP